MKLIAFAPFVVFAVSLAASSSAQGGSPAPSIPKAPTNVQRPPSVGWPHDILSGTGTNCARDPGPNEVMVFRDESFHGACAVMQPGFYPGPANLAVGNDVISSVKVGSAVRARVYRDASYGGGFEVLYPGPQASLGAFNDVISSMRIELTNREISCRSETLLEGEISLSTGINGFGDCVVLSADTSYADAAHIGLANDSILTINNHSSHTLQAFWNNAFTAPALTLAPHTGTLITAKLGHANADSVSSIRMQ